MFTTPLTYVVTSIFPKVYNTFLLVLEDSVIPFNPKAPEDDFGSIEVNDVCLRLHIELHRDLIALLVKEIPVSSFNLS